MTLPNGSSLRVAAFSPASPLDRVSGLLGYVVLELAGLIRIRGATVRRSRAGRLYVALPDRADRRGERRQLVTPINHDARTAIDDAVLDALMRAGHLPVVGEANPPRRPDAEPPR